MPFFSVIIPLYNKEKYIKKTLSKVLEQTFIDFEIIIINDGSTDNSLKEAYSISDKRITIYTQRNSGVSNARNLGIKKASSDYIALLDADDIWNPNHLEEHYNSIKKHPNGGLFCNAYGLKLLNNKIINAIYNIPKKKHPYIIDDYFLASIIHPIGWTSAIAFPKKDFYDVGEFNPLFTSGEDLDLMIRFGLKKTIVFNPKVTCYYDKTVTHSLSKLDHYEVRYTVFNSFKQEEVINKSLKQYLNLNRYSLAILCKLAKDKKTFQKLLPEIDRELLNSKQRILISLPSDLLILIKKIHLFFINKGIYISSFK
jgi:glycosyltransferase involved in cell wall biosynthesis